MKIWELKEGVEYVIGNRCIYMINGEDLRVRFIDDKLWESTSFAYDEIMNLNFTEYTPPTDWSKVEVDDKMLVSADNINWVNRHFAKYENNRVYAWSNGCTSFTADDEHEVMAWEYVKLYKEE